MVSTLYRSSNQLLTDKYRKEKKYNEALYFTEIKGFSQKELAEKLNISYSGAKSRVQRGRILLKNLLTECCTFHVDAYGTIIDYEKNQENILR